MIVTLWFDGDGTRVTQVYTDATSTLTTYYFFGGAYEVQDDGSTETILRYYAFAGGMVAMHDGARAPQARLETGEFLLPVGVVGGGMVGGIHHHPAQVTPAMLGDVDGGMELANVVH